eukprot:TRINITY_DN23087_c0_g1_i1.p2 TRINITY_DN23087_c0_g1~~TRINITY_DN23087_c0_g1_i1.p2  ORF type:complete len:182 (+),score=20.88 TRINITY_DN23087_c0_g1_i1:96-641(+)
MPFPDLHTELDLAFSIRRNRTLRLPFRHYSVDPITRNPNSNSPSLHRPHLNPHLRFNPNLQRQPTLQLQIRLERTGRRRVKISAAARSGGLEKGRVLGAVIERRKRSVGDVNAVGEDGDGDGVVVEDQFLVRVASGDAEVDGGVEVLSEVEGRDGERGEGEGGVVGAVDDPEGGGGDGEEK